MEDQNPTDRPGFKVKNYFVTFAEGDFVTENEDGTLGILVDIFKLDDNNKFQMLDPDTKEAEIENIRPDVEAWVNSALEAALKEAKKVIDDHESKE